MDGEADGSDVPEHAWIVEAVAGMSDGLVIVDEHARLVYHNTSAKRLVALDDFDPDIERWSEIHGIYHPDERTLFAPADLPLVRALHGEAVDDLHVYVRSAAVPAGVHAIVSACPIRDPSGRIRGASCLFRDISTLREKEARLHEVERQRKAILDNIPDMAWLKDEHGRYLIVNQPFAESAGRSRPEELVGLTDHDLYPAELAERYRNDDAEVMRSGLHKRVEEPFVYANGRELWIETAKTRIVDHEGKVTGTTGIARDITERRRADEAMRSAKDELERRVQERSVELAVAQENLVRQERLAILGQLAGGVAHQIRNPLAAIMNATYVLKRHLSPGQHPNVDDAIGIIHDEVRHANIIITGLLDYARVRTPDRHPASLVDLLERLLRAEWIPPNVRIIRRLPADDPVMRVVDADQLAGAISNVVQNAVDAMPSGGDLCVSLDVEPGVVRIRVADTGTGISPQVRGHLFEPLHSTKPMGIGLGLVTARRFVEAHGGTIASVDASRGAAFEIRLPG